MTGTEFVKEALSEGLTDGIKFYMVNRLIAKHAQVFRNDCQQGAWSNRPRSQWPDVLDRTEQFNVVPNYKAIDRLRDFLEDEIIITPWECKAGDYDVNRGPNSMITPCIIIEAGRLTEANRRLGRQCGVLVFIPFYIR